MSQISIEILSHRANPSTYYRWSKVNSPVTDLPNSIKEFSSVDNPNGHKFWVAVGSEYGYSTAGIQYPVSFTEEIMLDDDIKSIQFNCTPAVAWSFNTTTPYRVGMAQHALIKLGKYTQKDLDPELEFVTIEQRSIAHNGDFRDSLVSPIIDIIPDKGITHAIITYKGYANLAVLAATQPTPNTIDMPIFLCNDAIFELTLGN